MFSFCYREIMKSTKSELMLWWQRLKKHLKKDGQCKMEHLGQEITHVTILA